MIVTSNLKDFPAGELAKLNLEAKSPDDFVLDQIDIDDRRVWACMQEIRPRPWVRDSSRWIFGSRA